VGHPRKGRCHRPGEALAPPPPAHPPQGGGGAPAGHRLDPADLASFARRYRFAGGRVRRVRLRAGRQGALAVELLLTVRTALRELGTEPKPVRLRLRLDGVEEYRFQKRPTAAAGRIPDARVGYFDGQFFVNLDAWGLGPGETPKVHDFRASDAYAAGRELWWEEVPANPER
jgi:hypothetical protein